MKTIAPAAMAAIEAGEAVVTGAIEITPRGAGTVIRLWAGFGKLTIGGNDYQGIGDRVFAQRTSNAIGGIANGLTLTLSAIEPAALALLDASEVQGSSNTIYRLIFGPDGKSLLDAHVFDRGNGDALISDETIGGPAAVNYAVESSARGLGRSGARMRADSDQRLINASDGYFRNVSYAGQKMLYWGGQIPANAGQAIAPSPPSGNFSA